MIALMTYMKKLLNKINLKRVFHFLDTVHDSVVVEKDFLQSRFEKSSKYFHEVNQFMSLLDLANQQDGKIQLVNSIKGLSNKSIADIELIKNNLIHELINSKNEMFYYCKEYFSMYEFQNNRYLHYPTCRERLDYSGIRNLFIELGVVEMVKDGSYYFIDSQYEKKLKHLLVPKGSMSPRQLELIQSNNAKIGKKAELYILNYEMQRLSEHPRLVNIIEHIAEKSVNAGYDILSFDISNTIRSLKKRYIEVKAVPSKTFHFYMSKNEINTASQFKEQYFLYLLPVSTNGEFDISRLEIISDPVRNVLGNHQKWSSEIENYSFQKI